MEAIPLPTPERGQADLDSCLRGRRSIRDFTTDALTLEQLASLLWAAQGITDPGEGGRTAPSAGATYPLELYAVIGEVGGIEPGVYRYDPAEHALEAHATGDRREALVAASLHQDWMAVAPAVIAIAAIPERTAQRYGERAERYVHIEAGHAAENLCLMAVGLGLGTTVVGAFDDGKVARVLHLSESAAPILLLPVGRPR